MKLFMRASIIAALVAVPLFTLNAQEPALLKMPELKTKLLASEAFRGWVAAVGSYRGMEGENGCVAINGVAWTPSGVVVAMPRRIASGEEMCDIQTVRLEFEERQMTAWDDHGLTLPDNLRLWVWAGRAPTRFQFSVNSDRRWAWITSTLPEGVGIGSTGEAAKYKPWLAGENPGILVGGVYVNNAQGREAFHADRAQYESAPLLH